MDPISGTVVLSSFPFAPPEWMFYNGQLLNINTNHALYALIGTQYGGDCRSTFAPPDLRGHTPVAINDIVAPDRIVTAPVNVQGAPTRACVPGDTLGANVRLASSGAATTAPTPPLLAMRYH